jgi:hypothetical protein
MKRRRYGKLASTLPTIHYEMRLMLTKQNPIISHIEWGIINIEGFAPFKDAKLFPGGASPWDWNQFGTRHSPGIQIADLDELLLTNPTHIILSRGMQLVLQTKPETIEFLKSKGLNVEQLETTLAVKKYNELAQTGVKVAGLFHSTC